MQLGVFHYPGVDTEQLQTGALGVSVTVARGHRAVQTQTGIRRDTR